MEIKNLAFDNFWEILTNALGNEKLIRNWTVDKGYLRRGDFPAIYRGGEYIECRPPNAKYPQLVLKKDFQYMYDNWQDYLSGRIKRSVLRDKSRYTKYTISILHQYENLI